MRNRITPTRKLFYFRTFFGVPNPSVYKESVGLKKVQKNSVTRNFSLNDWQTGIRVHIPAMDSVTQFALGSTVAVAILGPRIGARAAMLTGGVLGTVPDLDTFLPSADAVAAFTSHRGATHSLLVHAIAAPLFAEGLMRLFKSLREERFRTWLAVYLIFATHALIDAMTIYGTRLFWPLYTEPVGVGSIFIIDPLYTIPLAVIVIWALFQGGWTERLRLWTKGALVFTTAYMVLTIPVQYVVKERASDSLAINGVEPERLFAVPMPFSILFWKVAAIDGDRYLNLYLPVFGGPDDIQVYAHPRRADLIECLEATNAAHRDLAAFSDGFYTLHVEDGMIVHSDLRMGATPDYAFRFAIADAETGEPLDPPLKIEEEREASDEDLDWLLSGVLQQTELRQTEAANAVELGDLTGRVQVAEACSS